MLNLKFKELKIKKEDEQLVAAVLARLAFVINPEVDEIEAFDICDEFLRQNGEIGVETVTLLARLIRAECLFDPARHMWN